MHGAGSGEIEDSVSEDGQLPIVVEASIGSAFLVDELPRLSNYRRRVGDDPASAVHAESRRVARRTTVFTSQLDGPRGSLVITRVGSIRKDCCRIPEDAVHGTYMRVRWPRWIRMLARRLRRHRRRKAAAQLLGYSLSSELLHALAVRNQERAQVEPEDAVACVVFSAMWLEAYVNEIGATIGLLAMSQDARIHDFQDWLEENPRISIEQKIDHFFDSFDRSPDSDLRERAQFLYKIRNELVHMKPGTLRSKRQGKGRPRVLHHNDPEGFAGRLKKYGLFPPTNFGPGAESLPWIFGLTQPRTARWAIGTATAMADALSKTFPDAQSRSSAWLRIPTREAELETDEGSRNP